MQVFNGKIRSEVESVISTFLPLSQNSISENFMTTNKLPNNQSTIKTCSVEQCQRQYHSKGFCRLHYMRNFRNQSFTLPERMHGTGCTIQEKFWSRVAVTADNARCWFWQGSPTEIYGQITINQTRWLVHIYSFYLTYGYKPSLCVLHSCDNPKCVNPNHLREGTHDDNMKDKVSRNRQIKGVKTRFAKLDDEKVVEIKRRLLDGESATSISRDYNVTKHPILNIKKGKTWKHVRLNG
jgi:hypothetical protein